MIAICPNPFRDKGCSLSRRVAALLNEHDIDVLTQHVNPISPLRVADERGVWTIGNNYDNCDLFPNTALTACVFHWESFFSERLEECVQHRFTGKHYWEGMESGLVSLAPLTGHVNEAAREAVAEEKARILDGEYDVFFGPVTDIYGIARIREDENLSDAQLLYDMYWFVDGVVME